MALAAESTHWYARDGSPAYTVIGANGKERPTTLRDARKLHLVPSVTTILSVAARPGLEAWKVDQALMAALTLPRIDGESLDAFKKRALADSKEHARMAAERGTAIHAAIEAAFRGDHDAIPAEFLPHAIGACDLVHDLCRQEWLAWGWEVERSFASSLGFGGKIDLHNPGIVIDFKTKEFGPDDECRAFDEQIMQLDAYRHGIGCPEATMANVFVSVTHPGLCQMVVHDDGNHFERFLRLLDYWKLAKGYDPAFDIVQQMRDEGVEVFEIGSIDDFNKIRDKTNDGGDDGTDP